MSRKLAREIAMKVSFAHLLGGENTYASILEQTEVEALPREEDIAFSDDVLQGVKAHEKELDERIAAHAIGWSISRMSRVDLCILRIALYEMLYREDITYSVSINEAVALAKRFGGEKSPAFINGILGAVFLELPEKADASQ